MLLLITPCKILHTRGAKAKQSRLVHIQIVLIFAKARLQSLQLARLPID
jgi:hypothetical protein